MEESRTCAQCQFYCKNLKGLMICEDYDGLYFQCEMQATERCPDFIKKDSVEGIKDLSGMERTLGYA